jgi:zinc protease
MIVSPVAAAPHEFVLANGLRVVVIPTATAPVATLLVVYRVGARNEAVGYTGSSHLLEHMLFKGTHANNRGNGRAFADIMNEIGASKNATTWLDRTMYFETVPVEYLPLAIELEADRMRSALIADVERRSEMTVVRNELERNDNSAARVLNQALVATAFREHPYHHPTIGWRADVEGVSTERLRDLYDTFYQPDNATVFIIGDVEYEPARALVEAHFGPLPAASHAIPEVYTTEPPQLGERSVVLKRPGDDTLLALAYHTPAAYGQTTVLGASELALRALAPPAHNPGYALELVGRILGRGRTSRLSRALVDEHLALEASAWNWGSRDPGLFQIVVNVRPGVKLEDARDATDRTLALLAAEGPTSEELARAKTQTAVQRAFGRDGTFALAQRLAELEAVGSWHIDDDYLERIEAVTVDDVRAAVADYLHEDNRSVGTLFPGSPKTFVRVNVQVPDGRRVLEADVPPVPLEVPHVLREHRFAERIARTHMPNGIESLYVANPGSATVVVRGLLDAGTAFGAGRPMLASVFAEMLARGTRAHARTAIEERLERAGVRRHYSVDDDRSQHFDPLAFRFTGACAEQDLPLLLEMLAEELREPHFREDELARVQSELTGTLRLLRTNTSWRAVQRFLQLAYESGDANDESDLDALLADVAATTVEDLQHFYAATLLKVRPLVSASGATDESAFAALAQRTLGSVPFESPATPALPTIGARPARMLREHVALERKSNVDIVIGRATPVVRASDDYLAAIVANGILGQSTLSSRLGLRLRDREGLTYGVTSGFLSGGRLPGPWRIGVSVNPASVERAIASALDVLEDYALRGPTARELVQQRNSMTGSQRVALATNGGVAHQLERIGLYALGDDYVDTYRERLESVTAADVARASAAYFGARDLIIVAAGTFEESAAHV